MKFFSIDSPLYKFMNRLKDIFLLSIMWVVFSIPIITMGAATTAAYSITLKMVNDEEGYIIGPFWKEFKANIKQGCIMGIIVEFAAYAIYLDFQLYMKASHSNLLFLIVGVIAIFLLYMHSIYAFALLARYDNSVIQTLRNSYSISIRYFLRTVALTVIVVIEICFIMWNLTTMFVGLLIGPGCIFLTVSGFARSFFENIERENDMEEKDSVVQTAYGDRQDDAEQ